MTKLAAAVRALTESPVSLTVNARLAQFQSFQSRPPDIVFPELCFCILAANFSGRRAWDVQTAIGGGFLSLEEGGLSLRLKELGYRFPNVRARHVVAARRFTPVLPGLIAASDSRAARDWIADTVPGLGLKEASHFLRNTGATDVAIVDVHVMRLLAYHHLLTPPKTLTRRRYHETEALLAALADDCGLTLAALDLYLWYLATGTVLK